MAKKIRFPLDMGNGIEVRTLEELQENFSIDRVLGYYADGKLLTWLKDRYLDDIADAVSILDKNDSGFVKNICDVFGVEYNEEINIEELEERNRRLKILKQYTEDKQYTDVINNIAFNQDELYDLLDEDKHTIYLCGDVFSIPLSKKGVRYIGINLPEVVISSKEQVDFEGKDIHLENVKFDEQYQIVISLNGMGNAERLYIEGKIKESLPLFEKEAKNNNGKAMYYLGEIYGKGYGGVYKNTEVAKEWYKKGYEKGNVLAKINYAFMLDDENEKIRIVKNSIEELKIISQDSIVAKYELADLYRLSKYIEEDYDTYILLNTECANAGFWLSMNVLGDAYRKGRGVKQSYEKAAEYYKKAADLGYSVAQDHLADCYSNGEGVEKNEKEAFKYYLMSAEQNNRHAQNEVGGAYWFGRGVEVDYCKAVIWFEKSAINGHESAQNNLGMAYYAGMGVEKNLEKAVYWIAKSAENYPTGKDNLFALLDLSPNDKFLGFYEGAIYCSEHVEHFTEKVCEIYWAL